MIIKYKKKSIEIPIVKTSFFRKGFGLMFRSRETKNLLFEFNNRYEKNITSLFVFFPFLAIWLDSDNKLVKTEIVRPFRFSIKAPARAKKLVEMPINRKNLGILRFFVGKKGKI